MDPATAPPVGYPHPSQQPQQMMNGGMMRSGPIPAGMNNFSAHGPPGMANPGIPMPMNAPQVPGNAMSPAMGGRGMTEQIQYQQDIHAITEGLAMANLSGGGAGTPTPGDPPFTFNPGPGQPFPGPQNNRLVQKMMSPPSYAGGRSKEQSKDVKPVVNGAKGSLTTSLPEVPAIFLTTEFMQSVARTLDDFDTQSLFRHEETGIDFEQDFREWFNPDDLDIK